MHFLAVACVTQCGNFSVDKLQQVRVNFSSNELFYATSWVTFMSLTLA